MSLLPSHEAWVRLALIGGISASMIASSALADPLLDIQRSSSWTYNAAGMIESETIEPDRPDLSVTTTYSYDAFGNKIATVISGSPSASPDAQFPQRGSSVELDGKGRFITKAINALGESETRTFDSKTGALLTQTGPNGLTSSTEYDSFGRKILERTPLTTDGAGVTKFAKSKTEYLWCSGLNGGTEVCPAGAKYLVRSKALADNEVDYLAAVSTVFFDLLDREIRRTAEEKTKLDGVWKTKRALAVDTVYDAQGRGLKKSEQFDLPVVNGVASVGAAAPTTGTSATVWTRNEYDALSRVVRVVEDTVGTGDAGTTGKQLSVHQYDGLTAKSFITRDLQADPAAMRMSFVAPGPLGDTTVQIRTTVKDSQGQTVSVTDGSGTLAASGTVTETGTHSAVLYSYDAFGSLTKTVVQGHDAADVTTTFTYDFRGRKTVMNDPDKGSWRYEYNALGELIRQTDAKGQVVTMSYDLLGRTIKKISRLAGGEVEKTDTWTFGTVAPEIGKAKETTSYAGLENPANETSFKNTTYDALGRPVSTVQRIQGVMSGQTADYDGTTGRLKKVILASGQVLGYVYDDMGALKKVTQGEGGSYAYWTGGERNARGQLLDFKLGNDVVTQRTYSRARGFLLGIKSGKVAANDVQDLTFEWDNLGILTRRTMDGGSGAGGYDEDFGYDELLRLTRSSVSNGNLLGTPSVALTYDGHGNILSKTGVGAYTYGGAGAGPHAVTSLDTGESFTYDANGNLTLSAGGTGPSRAVSWTSFNMPLQISGVRSTLDFTYDEAGGRILQVNRAKDAQQQLSLKTTKYYFDDVFGENRSERIVTHTANDAVTWTDQIVVDGEMVATIETPDANPNNRTIKYMHSDHLGSVQTVTAATPQPDGTIVLEKLDYDPWGQRRFGGTVGGSYAGDIDALGSLFGIQTDRGFTGHEMLDDVGLIHMNGRIYDARLARFLSADPFIQDPANAQNYNRYSYVNNNPLAATDPTGYWSFKPFKFLRRAFGAILRIPIIAAIVQIAAAYFGGPLGAAAAAALINASQGGNLGSVLKAAAIAYVSAVAFSAVGDVTVHGAGVETFMQPEHLMNIAGHAAIGCASSAAGGGSCQAGALSAGAGAFATPLISGIDPSVAAKDFSAPRLGLTAIVGGTASVLGGGKFANGAMTASMGYLFNQMAASAKGLTTSIEYDDGTLVERIGGSRAWRNNNPGNIIYNENSREWGAIGGQYGGPPGYETTMAVFPTEEVGGTALANLLRKPGYNNLNVGAAIERYAPAGAGNNVAVYRQNIQNSLGGISMGTAMSSLNNDQMSIVVRTIRKQEGWIAGTVKITKRNY